MALNDFFGDSPSYINPDYATDAQRKQQRAYAEMLMKRSSGDITRPAGAFANIIDALTGRLEMNRAGNLEQQALSHANDQSAALIAALQNGGQSAQPSQGNDSVASIPPPAADATAPPPVTATPPMGKVNPVAAAPGSPNAIVADRFAPAYDAIRTGEFDPQGLNSMPATPPVRVASLGSVGGGGAPAGPQGQPPVLPTAGAPATSGPMPVQPVQTAQLDPRLLSGILTNQMTPPESRALIGQLIGQKQGQDVYGNPTREGIVGGVQALPVGKGVTPGFRSETSISPTGISGTVVNPAANAQPGIQTGGGIGGAMNTMNTLANNAARSGAINEFQKQDLAAANNAPTIKRVAGIMLDDLRSHGDKMTFGPTAEWSNNIRKVAANYAPGLMKDQLESIASADSFDKMSAQLTSLLANGGGTDAQLFNNMRSVPGSHNSKEGAEALLKMTLQVADQQQALQQFTAKATTPQEYQDLKTEFYKRNPIINPITNNPIAQDLQGQRKAMQGGTPRVNSIEEARKLKSGTRFIDPNGVERIAP